MEKPEVKNSKLLYEGFFDLKLDTLEKQGVSDTYLTLLTKADAVCIIPKTKDNKYLVIKEYRHPIKQFVLGFPGGRIEYNEDPITSAKRELLEETGFTATSFSILQALYPLPSICDQKVYFILAEEIEKTNTQDLDPVECIAPYLLSKNEIQSQISHQSIDGVFLTALFLESQLK